MVVAQERGTLSSWFFRLTACLCISAGQVLAQQTEWQDQAHRLSGGLSKRASSTKASPGAASARRLTDSESICSWDDDTDQCNPDAAYMESLLSVFGDDSALFLVYERHMNCSSHQQESCGPSGDCIWTAQGCGAVLSNREVEGLLLGTIDATECGWLSASLQGKGCELNSPDVDNCTERCELRERVMALEGTCTYERVCKQTELDLLRSMCGDRVDPSILNIDCSMNGVETEDQVQNRLGYCYKHLCPDMGTYLGVFRGAEFHCGLMEDSESCAAESICVWHSGACRVDQLQVMWRELPINCAYRTAFTTLTACMGITNQQECGFGCVWIIDTECFEEEAVDETANGTNTVPSKGYCVPTSYSTLDAIADSGCSETGEARALSQLLYVLRVCSLEERRNRCRLTKEIAGAGCSTAPSSAPRSGPPSSWVAFASVAVTSLIVWLQLSM